MPLSRSNFRILPLGLFWPWLTGTWDGSLHLSSPWLSGDPEAGLLCLLAWFKPTRTFPAWLTSLGQAAWVSGVFVSPRAGLAQPVVILCPCPGLGVAGGPMASCRWDLCCILKVFMHASPLQLCSLSVHCRHLSRQLKFKCKKFKVSFEFLLTKGKKMQKKALEG